MANNINKKKLTKNAALHEDSFGEIVKKGVKVPVAHMLVDTIKFAVLLAGLLMVNWFIRALGASGYSEERLRTFELIHYDGSITVSAVYVIELIAKAVFSSWKTVSQSE